MTTTTQLNTGKSATVNASGVARVEIGPGQLETWHITTVAVKTSTNTLEPIAEVYLGPPSPVNLLGGTYTGSLDAGPENVVLQQGQFITCVWTGGDVGATATLSLSGTKTG